VRNPIALSLVVVLAIAAAFFAGHQTGLRNLHRNDMGQAIVVTGMGMAARAKIAVATFQSQNGKFPASNEEAGLPAAAQLQDRYVSSLSVGPQGIVTVMYRGEPALEGRTLVLTPVVVGGDYGMTWSCSGGTVAAELRPDVCR
jgi:type IV pilus assembly protein PilA